MHAQSQEKNPILYASIVYILGFLLFLEWLYPVKEMIQSANMMVLVMYALFCFLLTLTPVRWWASFILKGFGMLLIIHYLFFTEPFLSGLWMNEMFKEITVNVQAIIQRQWYEVTPVFQVGLLLVMIWFMSYLIYYWFVIAKHTVLFVILTFIYLAILDTFTTYDASFAVIRAFVISLISLGITHFMGVIQREVIEIARIRKKPLLFIALVFMVSFSAFIGYGAPKTDAQWPDPLSFVEDITGQGKGATSHKGGYREDDSKLGGSFEQDDTVVFQATTQKPHYWRIETKDVYTGKGWEQSTDPTYERQTDGKISLKTFSKQVEKEELETVVDVSDQIPLRKVLYPYGITSIEVETGSELVEFFLGDASEEIIPRIDDQDVALNHYVMTYDHPSYDVQALRQGGKDPDAIAERYTQLPAQLPERVAELAEDIVASYDNRYDQTKAIEKYFRSDDHGFVYQLNDVPVPQSGEDYVDQFLFDTKAGYCDNFSTSMVVMLRTLDIPARWVKGFTSGEKKAEQINRDGEIYDVYEVTNNNAHSWVEVYFPHVGWVPFEPTQGFSNFADFHMSTDLEDDEQSIEIPAPDVDEEHDERSSTDDSDDEEEEVVAEDEQEALATEQASSSFEFKTWYIALAIVSLTVMVWVLYRKRFHIGMYFFGKKMKHKSDAESFQDAYHYLLKLLGHKGYEKSSGETLREYAKEIDLSYATDAMGQLTGYYEQLIYNNRAHEAPISMKEIALWENFMKNILR